MQTQHSIVQLKKKDKSFEEFSSEEFYNQYEQVQQFFLKCREIGEVFRYSSRSKDAQDKAKKYFNDKYLPELKKLATTKELGDYIESIINTYEKFMGLFTPYRLKEETPTRKMLGFSQYKLHVSLSPESYQKHQKIISELLMNAIKDGTIPNFKYTQSKHLNNELIKLRKLLKSSQNEAEKAQIREDISRTERLINGDQFTIYIPANVDIDKLADLCSKINLKLTEVNAIPGQFAVSESKLTTFISFRQEYGLYDDGDEHYIKATDDAFKEYQETSDLYTQLKTKISETESHEISETESHEISETESHEISETESHEISETESHEISETESHEISETELKDIKDSIRKQINSIKPSQRYCFFRKGTEKIQALETLIFELENLEKRDGNVTNKQILEKIKDWENLKPDSTLNYREIIHKHRLGREDHSNPTKSDIMLIKIKEKLLPKPK